MFGNQSQSSPPSFVGATVLLGVKKNYKNVKTLTKMCQKEQSKIHWSGGSVPGSDARMVSCGLSWARTCVTLVRGQSCSGVEKTVPPPPVLMGRILA